MVICNGYKVHDLDYDVMRHWNHLKSIYGEIFKNQTYELCEQRNGYFYYCVCHFQATFDVYIGVVLGHVT